LFNRTVVTNSAGSLNDTAAFLQLTSNITGTGTDTGSVLGVTQSNSSASGAAIAISNAGSGNDITGTAGWNITKAGLATFANLIDSGLSINSAVYTNGSSQLTTTAPSSGAIGYWSRATTTLQPTTANDIVSIPTTNTTGADLAITNTGVYTGTGIFNLTANSATTGTIAAISGSGLTTGAELSVTSASNGFTSGNIFTLSLNSTAATGTAVSGSLFNSAFNQVYSTAVTNPSITGKAYSFTRGSTTNGSFASTLTVSSPVAYFADTYSQSTGSIVSSADVVQIIQGSSNNSGSALSVTSNSGSGAVFRVNDDGSFTDSTPFIIDVAGNVGIGNVSPGTLLGVGSSAQLTVNSSGNLSTSGTIATTGSGTITSANGLTNTTGIVSLTGTSGTIALTGFGTSSITSTTTAGNINTFADSSLAPGAAATALLLNLTFTNGSTNTSGASQVDGIRLTPILNNSGATGTKTTNGINILAPNLTCGGGACTYNGINVSNTASTSTFNSTALLVNGASSGSAGTQIGIDISGITAGTATETALRIGSKLGYLLRYSNARYYRRWSHHWCYWYNCCNR
jgi:hypothetical protein